MTGDRSDSGHSLHPTVICPRVSVRELPPAVTHQGIYTGLTSRQDLNLIRVSEWSSCLLRGLDNGLWPQSPDSDQTWCKVCRLSGSRPDIILGLSVVTGPRVAKCTDRPGTFCSN